MTDTNTGRFVWYELMTTDTKAAIAFYTNVVGWKTQPFGEGPYTMWVGGSGPLGGTMTLAEEAKKMGAPPHWMAHVLVADVDASVARAQKMGAKVYVPPTDIPTVGRFSVIADPQGATISMFKSASTMAARDAGKHGEIGWHELMTTDHEAALGFYGEMFGWQRMAEHDMGPMGKYVLFGVHGVMLGGMMTKPAGAPMPTAWLYYVTVDDLDAAIGRAKSGGAKVLNGPMDVPGGQRIVQLMDPQGAAFAMVTVPKA